MADFKKIAREKPKHLIKSFSDFDGDWTSYKRYLASEGELNPNIQVGNSLVNRPQPDPVARVPWAFKMWGQFTEQDKIALGEHLQKMTPEKRSAYIKFLQDPAKVGMPKDAA